MPAPNLFAESLATKNFGSRSFPGVTPYVLGGFFAVKKATRYTGTGRIAGQVRVITDPAPFRVVRLHNKATGELAAQTVADASANYEFNNLPLNVEFYILAFDETPGYDATVEDHVFAQP